MEVDITIVASTMDTARGEHGRPLTYTLPWPRTPLSASAEAVDAAVSPHGIGS